LRKMAFSEETFKIKNNAGEMMHGIIHHPVQENGGLVVMFNIGLHYRVCHSRLFVRQARELAQAGFRVVRMDTSKVGYSHGDFPSGRAIDSFDAVQTGLFKDDAIELMNYLKDRFKSQKIFFTGLCGGALTGIITAAADKDIKGLIFIAGPVTVTAAEYELSNLHPFYADLMISGYMKRISSPEAWVRFFTGKTSYRDLYRSLKVKLSDKLSVKKAKSAGDVKEMLGKEEEDKGDRFNRIFFQSFDSLIKSRRDILFITPELDRATFDFDRMFARPLLKHYGDYADHFQVARVPRANHTFSSPESTYQLFDISAHWLKTHLD
jgi:alpha/beta superfamily hydrolase